MPNSKSKDINDRLIEKHKAELAAANKTVSIMKEFNNNPKIGEYLTALKGKPKETKEDETKKLKPEIQKAIRLLEKLETPQLKMVLSLAKELGKKP